MRNSPTFATVLVSIRRAGVLARTAAVPIVKAVAGQLAVIWLELYEVDEVEVVWVKLQVGADRRVIMLAIEVSRKQEIPLRLRRVAAAFWLIWRKAITRAGPWQEWLLRAMS